MFSSLSLLCVLFALLSPTLIVAQTTPAPTSARLIYGRGATWVSGATPENPPGAISVFTPLSGKKPPAWWFRWMLSGKKFTVHARLAQGVYSVKLGFRSPASCVQGANVFTVYANNRAVLRNYDLARACNPARFEDVQVTVGKSAHLSIRLEASKGNAKLAFVTADALCMRLAANIIPDPDENHFAHSVPGSYPAVVDREGKGSARVFINGDGSHTHFSTTEGSGYIVSYEWTNMNTGEVISTKVSFSYTFPLGATKLRLTIFDNACTSHSAFTDIVVTGNQQNGGYCYYYRSSAWPTPGEAGLLKWPHPIYSRIMEKSPLTLSGSTANDRLFPLKNLPFSVRCIFFVGHMSPSDTHKDPNTGLPVDSLSVFTRGSGVARLYRDGEMVLDTSKAMNVNLPFVAGVASYELLFRYTVASASKPAFAAVWLNGKLPAITHDQSSILPVLRSVDPPSASAGGGARLRLTGHGLYRPLTVLFGNSGVTAEAERVGATSTQVFVTVPTTAAAGRLSGPVKLIARSSEGKRSNAVSVNFFQRGSSTCDDVKFSARKLVTTANNDLKLNQPTSAAMGPDGKLYVGTRGGRVKVVSYDAESLKVSSVCHSEVLSESDLKTPGGQLSPRAILGLTFNPAIAVPKPYVSTSTVFWGKVKHITTANKAAWANGRVIRLKPATVATKAKDQQQCLQRETTVIKGLPVSDGDHSVNEMVFTQNGDLLVAVGGNTNSGLPSIGLGGHWESFFSASVLIARLSRGANFNGVIPWVGVGNSRTARPKAGYTHVGLYATGVRNMFTMTMSRSGRIHGIDMGPNCKFGNVSTTCSQYVESEAAKQKKIKTVPSSVIVDPNAKQEECKYGPGRQDKLIRVLPNKFYGHPNLQRGRAGECSWIDPKTNKSPLKGVITPASYLKPMAMMASAKTGMVEYGANLFCGHVRGDLILSQNSEAGTWRARMSATETVIGRPFPFIDGGGIRVVENVHGALLFPRYKSDGVAVSMPVVQRSGMWHVVNAMPWRHRRNGGTRMTIGGWGFDGIDLKVTVGGKTCSGMKVNTKKTELSCVVPKRPVANTASYDIVVSQMGMQKKLTKALLYMNV